jgi:hypothetical protein
MKTIALLALILCFTSENNIVYVCDSSDTEVYHLEESCRGLKKCKGELKKITLDRAKSLKRRLCGFED